MKKILIIPLLLLLITGCSSNNADNDYDYDTNYKVINDNLIYHYTDKDTCVEYIVFKGSYQGGIIPRLNADGTIKLNEECLKNR